MEHVQTGAILEFEQQPFEGMEGDFIIRNVMEYCGCEGGEAQPLLQSSLLKLFIGECRNVLPGFYVVSVAAHTARSESGW